MLKSPKNRTILKWSLTTAAALLVLGAAIYFYFATLTHDDTAVVKPDFTVEAIPFIKEFEKDNKAANQKFAEKIIAVKGLVTAIEQSSDTTINIKMADSTSGSYLIFAFQEQHLPEARKIKEGDLVTVKGSCSDGVYSDILGTYFISFKRSMVLQ